MARLRRSFPGSMVQEVRSLLNGALKSDERARLRTIELADAGKSNAEIAKELRLSVVSVRIFHSRARKNGAKSLLNRKKGGRYREHLNTAAEAEILARELPKAKEGGVVVVSDIKKELEKAAGRTYHLNSVYRLLARHGWRKIAPRRVHPSQQDNAVADFKKSGQISLRKLEEQRNPKENRSASSSKTKRDSDASAPRAVAGRRAASGRSSKRNISANTSISLPLSIPSPESSRP